MCQRCVSERERKRSGFFSVSAINKRSMGYIANLRHISIKWINIFAQSYHECIIRLIDEKNYYLLFENWMNLICKIWMHITQGCFCAKYGWNFPIGSGEEDFLNFIINFLSISLLYTIWN